MTQPGEIPTQHNERETTCHHLPQKSCLPTPTTDTWKNWTVIISLRQFVDASAPSAEVVLAAQHAGFMKLFVTDPDYMKIFGPGDKPVSAEIRAFIEAQMTQGVMTSAHAAIDAASIVFAQSILDDCAWSYLKICAMVDPSAWEDLIDAKRLM